MKQWKLVNFCDFDKYAIKSYCAMHGVDESLNLGDITLLDETTMQPFTMITGGSPCQDFSIAGKQKGATWTCKDCKYQYNPLTVHWSKRDACPQCRSNDIEKTRSSLIVEFLRVIRANKPKFGIYENVKNIVGPQFISTFKLFVQELEEYGYIVHWSVLNAKNYGVPQNRERVYLIFIKKELDNNMFVFPKGFDNGIRLRDILETTVDEKYFISEKRMEIIRKNLNNVFDNNFIIGSSQKNAFVGDDSLSPSLTGAMGDGGGHTPMVKQICNINTTCGSWNNPQTGRVYNVDGISPTLNTCNGGDHEPKVMQICNINPSGTGMNGYVFDENGLAPTITTNKGEGNKVAIHELQVKERFFKQAVETLKSEEVNDGDTVDDAFNKRVNKSGYSPTLTTKPEGFKTAILPVTDTLRIRKLTPKECFRLMGFTDAEFNACAKYNSNAQLYKQAGNSIVVDVLYYILIELYNAMPYLFDDLKLTSLFSGIGAFETALKRLYNTINNPL